MSWKWILVATAWPLSIVVAFFWGSLWGFWDAVYPSNTHGRFIGTLAPEWLDDGREMKLTSDFIYIDPSNQAWLAPKGSVVDGASIPRFLWSVVGGPFEGKYRNASVVHDVACEEMKRNSNDVHRMFFDACLAGGVGEQEAKRLYWAVANYGPRWVFRQETKELLVDGPNNTKQKVEVTVEVPTRISFATEPTEADIKWSEKFFSENNVPIDAVPYIKPPSESP